MKSRSNCLQTASVRQDIISIFRLRVTNLITSKMKFYYCGGILGGRVRGCGLGVVFVFFFQFGLV